MSKFVVTDEEGNISWSAKKEAPESFNTFGRAESRAKELASFAPGKEIGIFELAATVKAPVGKIEVSKRHK